MFRKVMYEGNHETGEVDTAVHIRDNPAGNPSYAWVRYMKYLVKYSAPNTSIYVPITYT